MKNFLSLALPICFGISLILGSCARDNSVASNHRVQKTVIALLLTILFWLPGMIYAFIVCMDAGKI